MFENRPFVGPSFLKRKRRRHIKAKIGSGYYRQRFCVTFAFTLLITLFNMRKNN
jgi:hypothetical protein